MTINLEKFWDINVNFLDYIQSLKYKKRCNYKSYYYQLSKTVKDFRLCLVNKIAIVISFQAIYCRILFIRCKYNTKIIAIHVLFNHLDGVTYNFETFSFIRIAWQTSSSIICKDIGKILLNETLNNFHSLIILVFRYKIVKS